MRRTLTSSSSEADCKYPIDSGGIDENYIKKWKSNNSAAHNRRGGDYDYQWDH